MLGHQISQKLVSLVYPPCCFLCLRVLAESGSFNSRDADQDCDCVNQICGNLSDRCFKCGANTSPNNPFGNECVLCRNFKFHFERAIAIGDYRGLLQQSVIRMKRQFDDVMAIQFGRLMGNLLEKFDVSNDLDLIVPIPIHWSKRLRRKGFHGSDVIAEGIRHISGIKKNRRVLMSTRATAKQGKLSIRQRFQNINGALAVRRSVRLQDLQILLVDDVMTSGATVSEAAKVMMDAGAAKVFVAVVARGARVS